MSIVLNQSAGCITGLTAPLVVGTAVAAGDAVQLGQFVASLGASGSYIFPNGLKVVWGNCTVTTVAANTSVQVAVPFGSAFATCYGVQLTVNTGGTNQILSSRHIATYPTGFTYEAVSSVGGYVISSQYFAYGVA